MGNQIAPAPREPRTHDYTDRCWGHDYTFAPRANGQKGSMVGWGYGIAAGDYLLLAAPDGSTRYQVDAIRYLRDPTDMWHADVHFAPRPAAAQAVR